jgi:ribosome biogenesis GTPase
MTDLRKYKGTDRNNSRPGMGRLRRAHATDAGRLSGWENRVEDDAFIEKHAQTQKRSHAGEALLARFNRLASQTRAQVGEPAEICGFVGKEVVVRFPAGDEMTCTVRQVLKKQISGVKNPLCVGDQVRVEREPDAVIATVEPRRNQLARADSHNRSLIHVFAANLDRLVIVSAVKEPDLKPGLIDRYLLIAALNDIPAALVLNKTDLGDGGAMAELYRAIGVPVFCTDAVHGSGDLPALHALLHGQACVVAGQSGVGKSSLINALFPHVGARTGSVAIEGFGRHTTTAARSYPLPGGGRLVDTPGIRECAITGLSTLDVALLYPDLAALHPHCHFADCSHLHEPGCAVQAAIEAGTLPWTRYESYRSIVEEDLA